MKPGATPDEVHDQAMRVAYHCEARCGRCGLAITIYTLRSVDDAPGRLFSVCMHCGDTLAHRVAECVDTSDPLAVAAAVAEIERLVTGEPTTVRMVA